MSLEMNQIYEELGIQKEVYEFGRKAEEELAPRFREFEKTAEFNQLKVLHAMQENRVNEGCFQFASGYGYNDRIIACGEAGIGGNGEGGGLTRFNRGNIGAGQRKVCKIAQRNHKTGKCRRANIFNGKGHPGCLCISFGQRREKLR